MSESVPGINHNASFRAATSEVLHALQEEAVAAALGNSSASGAAAAGPMRIASARQYAELRLGGGGSSSRRGTFMGRPIASGISNPYSAVVSLQRSDAPTPLSPNAAQGYAIPVDSSQHINAGPEEMLAAADFARADAFSKSFAGMEAAAAAALGAHSAGALAARDDPDAVDAKGMPLVPRDGSAAAGSAHTNGGFEPMVPVSKATSVASIGGGAAGEPIVVANAVSSATVTQMQIVYPPFTVANFIAVAAFAILGVAARVLFGVLTGDAKFFMSDAYFAPNLIGSFIIGLAVASPMKAFIPTTQTGVSVGFCGSLTTFSSWMLATTGAATWNTGIVELVSGLCFPFIAFQMGRDAAAWLPATATTRPTLDKIFVSLSVVLALTFVALTAVFRETKIGDGTAGALGEAVLYTSILGPIGAFPRYVLSLRLNTRFKHLFPVGTLTANCLAFVLVASLYNQCPKDVHWCDYISVGVGGALSTVSSWVFDTVTLYEGPPNGHGRIKAYLYGAGSTALGLIITGVGVKIPRNAS